MRFLKAGLSVLLILIVGCAVDVSAQVAIDTAFTARGARPFDQPIDPDLYLIRPGEQLEVVFLNAKLGSLRLNVNSEGRLVHRDLGVFDLAGKTLSKTRELLLDPLARLFNAPDIVISVSMIYPVYIQVSGMVNRPGAYLGFTSQRVSEIIDSAGGIAPGGSSRRIRFHGGPDSLAVDLDRYASDANCRFNPCLYAGDRIHVPYRTGAEVQVIGEVAFPRTVELIADESLADILPLTGGLLPGADRDGAYLLNDSARDIKQRGSLRPGDVLVVPTGPDAIMENRVSMVGAITRPGLYDLNGRTTLAELIATAGGFVADANRKRVTVFRLPEKATFDHRVQGRYALGLANGHRMDDLVLKPGDSVYFPVAMGYVSVTGLVARPGMVPYSEDKTVDVYIRMVGGYADPATEPIVEVTDRVSGVTRPAMSGTSVYDGDLIIVKAGETGR